MGDHVRWAIAHEGCRVFHSDPQGSSPTAQQVDLAALRACMIAKQVNNAEAATMIKNAPDSVLRAAVKAAIDSIDSELRENLRWVAEHERKRAALLDFANKNDFESLRQIYESAQENNPKASKLLAGVSNVRLQELLQQIPPDSRQASPTESLKANVKWSIEHEGCAFFEPDSSGSDERLRPLSDLKQCFVQSQRHNPDATKSITSGDETQLAAAITASTQQISLEAVTNINWVAEHEGQLSAFRRLLATHDFGVIRTLYSAAQQHNPAARNQLAGVSDKRLKELITELVVRNGVPPTDLNPLTGRPDERIAVINLRALNQPAIEQLQIAALQRAPIARWRPQSIQDGGPLAQVLRRMYDTSPEFANALCAVVAPANHVSCDTIVSPATQLLLPMLPTRPSPTASPSIAQTLDVSTDTTFMAIGNAPITGAPPEGRQAATFLLTGRPDQIAAVTNALPPDAPRYVGPTYEVALVITTAAAADRAEPTAAPPPAVPLLNALQTNDKYYVLDFFKYVKTGEQCPHGQRVLEVIKQEFHRRGADNLYQTNVVPMELDYYRTPSTHQLLADYIDRQDDSTKAVLTSVVAEFAKRCELALHSPASVPPNEVPILYLHALYDTILRDVKATVISSSFFTESSQFSLLPATFGASSSPLILSAVADSDIIDIEANPLEPMHTLYVGRVTYPVLLVGALLSSGQAFGMSSKNGDGVSCLGRGDGWGGGSTCIKPQEPGTSFATPSVAATAFLARALWKASGHPLTALQIRDRILRAVPLVPSISAHYSSAGVPDPLWLGTGAPVIVITSSGAVQSLASISGSVEFRLPQQQPTTLVLGTSSFNISGLQYIDGRWFLYPNADRRWREVTLSKLDIRLPGQNNHIDLANFVANYKGVILYE